ncbi:DUF1836 domain-containing protein [Alloiococcus sp. CFN-8]|uniref:DUF1836 domain-containing protein n=1 Tax=Alloiococcus sp. CFN-8 TaxID=3416081 RepID=UPI003CFAC2BA
MHKDTFCMKELMELVEDISSHNLVPYEELPKYDFFLSQVIDYLNDNFTEEMYTNNIIQNYIKSEIISKPEAGKKRGYTKVHLIQLVLISYMRPILTTEEIRKVLKLAFNSIDDRSDDIISWEDAYKIFSNIHQNKRSILDNPCGFGDSLDEIVHAMELSPDEEERIELFLTVMALISQASIIKKLVQRLIHDYSDIEEKE